MLTFAAKFEGVVILFWLLPGESPPTPDSVDDAGSLAFSAANAKELFVGDRECIAIAYQIHLSFEVKHKNRKF